MIRQEIPGHKKQTFGGVGRYGAVGFSLGSKGYVGAGKSETILVQDFWEWDQATNLWTQKANYPATFTAETKGFTIGNKGYAGVGTNTAVGTKILPV